MIVVMIVAMVLAIVAMVFALVVININIGTGACLLHKKAGIACFFTFRVLHIVGATPSSRWFLQLSRWFSAPSR